jgi:hypothetical protein
MIPRHLLPKCVQDDLAGAEKIRTVVYLVALYAALLIVMFMVIHFAPQIDAWRMQ